MSNLGNRGLLDYRNSCYIYVIYNQVLKLLCMLNMHTVPQGHVTMILGGALDLSSIL
ncbi:hypothetical protein CI610_03425 [invertebrate metagenome]|uniref:Uncharacterized protein n=1 Tax=invertebrate metagenome TaxID=1711999 RepID=A0A2H9T342_9ZZZZ